MIKAVVFDLDDTIYDYECCHEKAMEHLKKYCIEKFSISEECFEKNFNAAKDMVKQQLGNVGASHNRMLYMQKFLELIKEKPVMYGLELYDQYWDTMLEKMQPFQYVIPLFKELVDRGIRIAVLTDLTAHIQHRKIQRLGIAEYCDVLVSSEEAGREKPDKGMFDLVIEKLMLKPEQMIMIGDSYTKDVQGAQEAGMHTILYDKKKEEVIVKKCLEMIKHEAESE